MPSVQPRSTRVALAPLALAGLLGLTGCGSSSNAPVTRRDLVVARPVSVSPTLPQTTRSAPSGQPPARAQAETRPPPPAQTQPAPGRRPGALVEAPRPGADLSRPPAGGAPEQATGAQVESTIKVAASEPEADPAPEPRPEPPAPAPSADWWTLEPEPAPGRLRIVASGEGENLRSARQAAVERGLAELRRRLGADPEGVTYERTTVQPIGSGRLRGYVLVSCDDPG